MNMRCHFTIVILWLVIASVGWLQADEVRLSDGRVLEGEIVSPPDAEMLDLRTGSSSLSVIQHFPRSQVVAVTYGASPRQKALAAIVADATRLGDGGTAEQWWALAERAREAGDSPYHRELAGIAVERDRNHAAARRALGMVTYKGVWMRPNEAAVARGEVLHEGRFLTWADREAAIHQAQVRKDQLIARRAEQEKAARERRLRAAAEAAVYSDPGPGLGIRASSSGGHHGYAHGSSYHVIYWPGLYPAPVPHCGGSSVSLSVSGSHDHGNWSFSWSK